MEAALIALQQERQKEGAEETFGLSRVAQKDLADACRSLAQALRQVAAETSSASLEESEKKSSRSDVAEWLWNMCSSLNHSLGSLHLALAIHQAVQLDDEAAVQAALFDVLGEQAIDSLMEIAARIPEIRQLSEQEIRRQGGEPDLVLDGEEEVLVDVEEERKQYLIQQAREAAHVAALAAAEAAPASSSGISSSSRGTHTVTRQSDKDAQKTAKKAAKRAAAALQAAKDAGAIVDESDLLQLDGDSAQIGPGGLQGMSQEALWDIQRSLAPEGTREHYQKQGLPAGTEREYGEDYEKVTIPAKIMDPSKLHPRLQLEEAMDAKCRLAFEGTSSLNPMQSQVFEAAFHSRENLLICAPTGAGKTNVAMLAVVAHFRDAGIIENPDDPYATYKNIGSTNNNAGQRKKVIYIAPMKALAQEVVEKFSSKLKKLKLIVRELTGDMQLTRAEADSADVIVTTPEKWDVVTRKGGDGSLAQTCGLLIIDEVHLLADERGAVIESVVARLHRLVESSQTQVRIVGLSATLPNYKDVATFLRVHPERGLFYFGPEHRPVPLQQTFIGVAIATKGRDRARREKKMNDLCYEVVTDSLRRGYQVMVFVHSRRGTGDTARALAEQAGLMNELDELFVTQGKENGTAAYSKYATRVQKSRNREVAMHFEKGMGIHHAGMLRTDRKLTEQMFADGAIKVLCCTATLAWGINVVIKGTEVYNPEKGGAVDLSILDVMQIFGRAGRPQFDTSGEATLITSYEALARYLDKLVRAVPIESNFIKRLSDHLNAEVVGGTVTNIQEAAIWLTYTYLHVRMTRNPLAYGVTPDQAMDDPNLRERSLELVEQAAKQLDGLQMLKYNEQSGNLSTTDMGRVASHFYIRSESVAIFNESLANVEYPTDADLCDVICNATEFENVKVRPDELKEIDTLKNKACPIQVKTPVEEFSGKCGVLLQAYISNAKLTSFTLISDTNYIASNAGRVARALFEMCLRNGRASAARKLLRIAKSVDRRIWWFHSPLRQFEDELPSNVYVALESRLSAGTESGYDSLDSTTALLDMQPREVGQFCHWSRGGEKIQRLIGMLPRVEIECRVQPVTRGVLRFQIRLDPVFTWHGRWHGGAQGFWLWIEDNDQNRIYHHEYIHFARRTHPEPTSLDLSIPAFDPLPPHYFIQVMSDAWVGSEMLLPVSFRDIQLPSSTMPHTDLLDLTPLPTSALQDPAYEQLYATFENFNPIQTQLFHVLYHTDTPVLLGAPTGSGKTIVAELALLRMKKLYPKGKCIYIAPMKSLARERLKEWQSRLGAPPLKWNVLELSGDTRHDRRALSNADVLVCTPEKWDLISRGWRGGGDSFSDSNVTNGRDFVKQVRLLVLDECHLLGEERGAVLEAIVSRTRFISRFVDSNERQASSDEHEESNKQNEATRIIGLSTALANPYDLADWIGIDTQGHGVMAKRGLYNFRPSVRPVPMEVHVQGFPGRHYCPRMATMNKPCYAAIKDHSPRQPVIIFVASRRQTRLTALDIISYAAADEVPRTFLGCSEDYIEAVADTIQDEALKHTLTFGIGLHHAGLSSHDRETVEKLFLNGEIQALVATATLAWGVNLPAHLVIVKGTEFFDGKTSRYVDYPVTDVLQMIGRAGRPQFDTKGVAVVMVAEGKKNFYKRFLYIPFPVESCLGERMCENINAEIAIGTINSLVEATGYLSWTFYARRVKANPSYYGAKSGNDEDVEKFLFSVVKETVQKLKDHACVELETGDANYGAEVATTRLGQACANYYLQHRTPKQMQMGTREVRNILSKLLESVEEPKALPLDVNSPSQNGRAIQPFVWPSHVETAAFAHLLYSLSHTHEFNELPVRHNEEYLNAELSQKLPWGPDSKAVVAGKSPEREFVSQDMDVMADPHTKCFLLLQANLMRVKLPISDYINDTKSVLDQVPRLLAAMQYVSLVDQTTAGSMDLMCVFAKARQLLASRTMPGEDPVLQIPGVIGDSLQKERKQGPSSLDSLLTLRSLREEAKVKLSKVVARRKGALDRAMTMLESLPLISVDDVEVKHELEKSTGKSVGILDLKLSLQQQRTGGRRNNNRRLVGVSLVLGTHQRHVLLSYQSLNLPTHSSTKSATLKFDWSAANANGGPDGGSVVLRILLEEVRGMDMQMTIPLR